MMFFVYFSDEIRGLARKRVPIIGGVLFKKMIVFVYFSDEMGRKYLVSAVKLQKWGGIYLGIFRHKTIPHV